MRGILKYRIIILLFIFVTIIRLNCKAEEICNHEWCITGFQRQDCYHDGYEDRYCYLCRKQEHLTFPKTEHDWGEWEIVTEPTCLKEGEEERQCSICYKYQTRTVSTTPHIWGEWQICQDASCSEEGIERKYCNLCYTCGEERTIPKAEHVWDEWTTDSQPTLVKKGVKSRQCSNCYEIEEVSIPVKKASKQEKQALKAVQQYLGAVKKYDINKMLSAFEKRPNDLCFESKPYMAKICRKYNKRDFKYEITNVKTKGKYIYVYATVEYTNGFNTFYKALCKSYDDAYQFILDNNRVMNQDEIYANIQKNIEESVKKRKMKKTITDNVSFKMKKKSGKWKIVMGKNAYIGYVDFTNCNYQTAYSEAGLYADSKLEDFAWKYAYKYGGY